MVQFIFTGAQGTGKTTILKECAGKNPDIEIITEVVRDLSKTGVKINESGDEQGQDIIFNTYKNKLGQNKSFISDRGLTDVLAYTMYLAECGKISKDFVDKQLNEFVEFNKQHQNILYFYFPIEFPVVDDGVRSVDENFRKSIDENIKSLLDEHDINYIQVTGDVESRLGIVSAALIIEASNECLGNMS